MKRIDPHDTVISVGEGRGFVVDARVGRLVVTAAHCLPQPPPTYRWNSDGTNVYQKLLGPPGDQPPSVWAECLFLDAVADIAVLGPVSHDDLLQQLKNYRDFVNEIVPLRVPRRSRPASHGQAFLPSLEGKWFKCSTEPALRGMLYFSKAAKKIIGGMSGSPIVSENGRAIGVVCTGSLTSGEECREGGPNPGPPHNLPAWICDDLC